MRSTAVEATDCRRRRRAAARRRPRSQLKRLPASPARIARSAAGELWIIQFVSLFRLNQMTVLTSEWARSQANRFVIHCALPRPLPEVAVSESSIGSPPARFSSWATERPQIWLIVRQSPLRARLPPLRHVSPRASTYPRPGNSAPGAPETGDQTQITLCAPAREKIRCTWRQARMNSPARFPFTPRPQGYQNPFISWAKRSRTGLPYAAKPRAHERR